jgi:hypothetical protein
MTGFRLMQCEIDTYSGRSSSRARCAPKRKNKQKKMGASILKQHEFFALLP